MINFFKNRNYIEMKYSDYRNGLNDLMDECPGVVEYDEYDFLYFLDCVLNPDCAFFEEIKNTLTQMEQ